MHPLHIGIDARLPAVRSGGISEYVVELIAGLATFDADARFTIFHSAGDPVDRMPAGASRMTRADLRTPCHHPYERVMLAGELAPHRLDLFHSPDFIPPSGGVPRRVISVHDLAFHEHPEWMTPDSQRYYGSQIEAAVTQADAVICISQHTRDAVLRSFPLPPAKVHLTPLAASARYEQSPSDAHRAETLARYGLMPGYVLVVGTIEPRKNVAMALEAHAQLRARHGLAVPLVHVGETGWLADDVVRTFELGDPLVRRLGSVPAADLPCLYAAAGVLAMPSLTEGFGLPVIEAMQCGCPVVASTGGALPETAGDAALLVGPLDLDGWIDALRRALTDDPTRSMLRERGRAHAARFSWQRTAAATLAIYQAVASTSAR